MLLVPVILICGALYPILANRGLQRQANLARLATVALTILLALTGLAGAPAPTYAWAIIAGLILGLIGDIFFVLPQERFVPGLVAYLLGHFAYIYGVLWAGGFQFGQWPLLLGVGALTLYLFLRAARGMREKGQKELVVPAGVYSAVLAVMLWLTAGTLLQGEVLPFRPLFLALAGGFFYFADATLVWHRFVRPVRNQPLVEMCSYFAGQFFFAASVAWPPA